MRTDELVNHAVEAVDSLGAAHITKRDLRLNASLLFQLTEAVRATVIVRAAGGAATAERLFPVELLARNEWRGAARRPCRNSSPLSPCPTITPCPS